MKRGRGYEERHADLEEGRVRKRRRSTKDSRSSKAYQDLLAPPQLRSSATSNGEPRVPGLVPNAQGFHRTTQFLMEYLDLVAWKGFKLLSAARRCKASVKKFERSQMELIELGGSLAKFQAERGKVTSDDKGSDDMTSKAKRK